MMRRGGDRRPARVAKLAMLRSLNGVAVLVDDDADVAPRPALQAFPCWSPIGRAHRATQQELRTAQEREGRT